VFAVTEIPMWPVQGLFGTPVVSADGREVGTLVDILVDARRACATALVIRRPGDANERVIASSSLELRRERGVVVATAADTVDDTSGSWPGSCVRISRLRNRRVLTHRGTDIGAVDDVCLDVHGHIAAYDVVNSGCGSPIRLRGRLLHAWGMMIGETLTLTEAAGDEPTLAMQPDLRR
jgi:sporulation protein YlmC with PRC-barrel domain